MIAEGHSIERREGGKRDGAILLGHELPGYDPSGSLVLLLGRELGAEILE